jgi:hypothetical protein
MRKDPFNIHACLALDSRQLRLKPVRDSLALLAGTVASPMPVRSRHRDLSPSKRKGGALNPPYKLVNGDR